MKIWWRVQHGAAEPVGLQLTSWQDEDWDPEIREHFTVLPESDADVELPSIGSQLVKTLPVGRLLAQSRQGIGDLLASHQLPLGWSEEDRELFEQEHAELGQEWAPALEVVARGPRDLGQEHYREVARVYAAAARAGQPPTVAVAEHFTLSKSAAAKQVARARERGLLPKTSRGRVGKLSEEL